MGCGASSNAAQKYELGAADAIPLRKDAPPGGSTNIEWQSLAPSHADAPDTLGDVAPTSEKIDATMAAVFSAERSSERRIASSASSLGTIVAPSSTSSAELHTLHAVHNA